MLARAIRSVLAQSYKDFELIVVDDGSKEDLNEAKAEQGVNWVYQERLGVAAARNAGIRKAKGDWITLLDSDDCWQPNKLAAQIEFHRDHPELLLSQCQERWHRNGFRVNKKEIHQMACGDAFVSSLKRCCISASSIMLHRDVADNIGYFDEAMAVCEDYDYWIRVTAKYKIGLIDEELVYKYGGHADQLSRSQPAMDRFRLYALLKLLQESDLSETQREQTRQEAVSKAYILSIGAKKRAPHRERFYKNTITAIEREKGLKPYINSLKMDIYPAKPQQPLSRAEVANI